jgi:cytochrome P450
MINPDLATKLRPWIRSRVDEIVKKLRGKEHFDLIDDLALRLPLELIRKALGVDDSNAAQFHRWTVDLGGFAGREWIRRGGLTNRLSSTRPEIAGFCWNTCS